MLTRFEVQDNCLIFDITLYTPLCTKEYTIGLDLNQREISGDVVAYGSWYDIDEEECWDALKVEFEANPRFYEELRKMIIPEEVSSDV